jgi:alcohol dehydrogenase
MNQKTMKALVCESPGNYALREVAVPQIVDPTDVIGRVTLAAICTSDIHYVKGELATAVYPRTMGHEFCVEIVETGAAVKTHKVGDRCVVKPGASCGECFMCQLGIRSGCVKGGIFGSIGHLEGCHAEYVRIPFADSTGQLIPIPDGLSDEDVIMLPDMLATAWFGIVGAGLAEGQSVAVIGVGPVGLSTCLLAKQLFKARTVIAVDLLQERVDLAVASGVADFGINAATENVGSRVQELVGPLGVDVTIETAGEEDALETSANITRPSGVLSTVSIFPKSMMPTPMNTMMVKNISFKYGIQQCAGLPEMLAAIRAGSIDTGFMMTHKRPLNDIEEGYRVFGSKADGCIKWLVTPWQN